MGAASARTGLAIWGFAFGYFACYWPYSALAKAVTDGSYPGMEAGIPGVQLLPLTAMASLAGMFAFITAMRWWRHAGRRTVLGVSIPFPGRWTFMSGLCTAAIIPTTTLAYTFDGVSIVFMMLLMRGGVLIIAPIVDRVSRRRVSWFSWLGLGLSLGALVVSFAGKAGFAITVVAAVDVAIYLAAYFVRLRFMSRIAKSDDLDARTRYFVEEQMTATPVLVLSLGVMALIGSGGFMAAVRDGFTAIWGSGMVAEGLVIGLFSQGTGIFGSLILLDRRENTYCVPVNRSSSVLAGILATLSLTVLLGTKPPPWTEFAGAAMIVLAIVMLSLPALAAARRRATTGPNG